MDNASNLFTVISRHFSLSGFAMSVIGVFDRFSSRPQRRFALFLLSGFACDFSKVGFTYLLLCRLGQFLTGSFMVASNMLFRGKPFKIVNMVIGFISVFMVYMVRSFWFFKPADSNHPVDQPLTASYKVAHRMCSQFARYKVFNNITTFRNSIDMVKQTIFNPINQDVLHDNLPNVFMYSNYIRVSCQA